MIPRIFTKKIDTDRITPTKEESRHINVMRLRDGDYIEVMDGKGIIAKAKIYITPKPYIEILEKMKFPPPPEIWAGIPILKPKRASFLIEKLGELGIKGIFPLKTKFTQGYRYNNVKNRWKNILISAIKQSGNPYIPDIKTAKDIKEILNMDFDTIIFAEKTGERDLHFSGKSLFIVGPEGGFSEKEKTSLLKSGAVPVNLGKYTLRAETAGIILVAEAMRKAAVGG